MKHMGLLKGVRTQLSPHVPADADFLCNEATVFGLAIEDTPCIQFRIDIP